MKITQEVRNDEEMGIVNNTMHFKKENTIEKKSEGNEIESLISKTKNQDNLPENSDGTNKNFEDLLLEKIKSN